MGRRPLLNPPVSEPKIVGVSCWQGRPQDLGAQLKGPFHASEDSRFPVRRHEICRADIGFGKVKLKGQPGTSPWATTYRAAGGWFEDRGEMRVPLARSRRFYYRPLS